MMYGKAKGQYIASPEIGAGKGYSLWAWDVGSSFIFDVNEGWTREGAATFFWGKTIQEVCKLEIIVMCGELCNEPI